MPESFYRELRKRGGAKRWRTLRLPNGEFAHIAVTRKEGARSGTTLMGEIHKKMRA